MMTMGRNLRSRRYDKDWTRREVAEKLQMSCRKYSRIERGLEDMDLSTACRIAALYQTDIATLMTNPVFRFKLSRALHKPYKQTLEKFTKLDIMLCVKMVEVEELMLEHNTLQPPEQQLPPSQG